ncbi:gelsolin-like protein 1 [Sycon ciliatum]|uniref:gelsolin-like protein 1 n=1 Tax=Sycon ciliatum TaxID=27933 RepID=UPI0020A9A123|eukprot:scpid71405/ scgid28209/ Gelsolin-like protein 1; Actin-modulator
MAGLVKGKDYDWKDSNMSLFGSDLEKNVKKASADTEAAWDHAGLKVGVQVWRIEKFKVKHWAEEDHGKFYSGDSYIILNTYKNPDEDDLEYDLHFWIGSKSTQDEYGTAAYKTVELDTKLNDKPVQYREVQGYESDLFKKVFSTIQIWNGGVDSGFNHVKPTQYEPRLLHFKGTKKSVVCNEIDLVKDNVTSDDVFILDLGRKIYQFNGKESSKDERLKAMQFLQTLKSERNGRATVEVIDEASDRRPAYFFSHLEEGEATHQRKDEATLKSFEKVMFRLSDSSGEMQFSEVARGSLKRAALDSNDVFIVDGGTEIFVWIGKNASSDEKRRAAEFGHKYAQGSDHPLVPIANIKEGREPAKFFTFF